MSVKKILAISFISLFLFGTAVLFAQQPATSTETKERSVEELYLTNPSVRLAYEVSKADNRDDKLLALVQIQSLLDEGLKGEDERAIATILGNLASEGTTVIIRDRGRVVNNYPDVRWMACRSLSYVKTEEGKKKATDVLIVVLQQDNDYLVKTNAIYSLGIIGLNENNTTSRAIASAVEFQDYSAPNDALAMSAIVAIERLMDSDDGVTDGVSMRAMIKIQQGTYAKEVKDRAREVLDKLRQQTN
ncbi:MAG: HEAT repeat domain-containing protein [Spirochaetaceae bacterium]|nr:MAG: HEAT repeat domain-containing protein [Spirochaetaceae bacterium]